MGIGKYLSPLCLLQRRGNTPKRAAGISSAPSTEHKGTFVFIRAPKLNQRRLGSIRGFGRIGARKKSKKEGGEAGGMKGTKIHEGLEYRKEWRFYVRIKLKE